MQDLFDDETDDRIIVTGIDKQDKQVQQYSRNYQQRQRYLEALRLFKPLQKHYSQTKEEVCVQTLDRLREPATRTTGV